MPFFIIGGLLILIALVINERNARYLLAGYNRLSEEERKNYNIKGFLIWFKGIFLSIGIGLLILPTIMNWIGLGKYVYIATVIIPLFLIGFLLIKSQSYFHDHSLVKKSIINYLVVSILGIVTIGVIILYYYGLAPNKLEVEGDHIKISGFYGEQIILDSITEVKITRSLPSLVMRTNGFAAGKSLKGYFKTQKGDIIKLFVNTDHKNFLEIKTAARTYFWNSDSENMDEILKEINALKK